MRPLKRRKVELDQATSRLAKPFHSPMSADDSRSPTDSSTKRVSSELQVPGNEPQEPRSITMNGPYHNNSSASRTALSPFPRTVHPAPAADPAALQREYAALGRQLTSLRQSLDTAQQALKIRTAEQDVQNQALIAKWKGVVREAAEDLFDAAKESFKSQRTDDRQPQEREFSAWEEEERNELTEDQREMLEVHEAEAKAQAERYGLLEPHGSPNEGSSQTYTMDMMLQQMNVDLGLVGYDKESQEWVN